MDSFTIPSSFQDLEREPYNLLPYPEDFRDDNEAVCADSFEALVEKLEQGNRYLLEGGTIDQERLQALYTLVRKATSLSPSTRERLVTALGQAVAILSDKLSPSFRDVFAYHIYMLYSLLFSVLVKESKLVESTERRRCVDALLSAAKAMGTQTDWPEDLLLIPCRIAYPLLERATGVIARKAACGDTALLLVAVTVQHHQEVVGTVTAALIDLMHSFEHTASLVAEICQQESTDRLAIELIREMGRLDGSDNKAALGLKQVAPFLSHLAERRPKLVYQNLSHILPQFQAESYPLRSAMVQTVAHILEFAHKEQDESNPVDTSKTQEQLLAILMERVYDVSSYTRAAALKALIQLVLSNSLSRDALLPITKLALDRLQDKTVVVRKQAMQLLTTLLENHPFLGALDPKPFRQKLTELTAYVKQHMPDHLRQAHGDTMDKEIDPDSCLELEQALFSAAIAEADHLMQESGGDLSGEQYEYCSKIQALKFTQSALEFISLLEGANVALEGMLLSANASDVTEALRFFVQARHFQLPCAITGMKRALALMWSSEQGIRDEVLKAFVEVFIAEPGSEGADLLPDNQIAKNLLVLTGQASVSELASIEEAVHCLVKEEKIPLDVFLILWSIASKGSADARAAALRLLSMGAGADPSLIDSKSRLKLLLDAGLGEFTQERHDWRLAAAASMCLQRVARAKIDPTDAKYLVMERIIDELCAVARGDWCVDEKEDDSLCWFSAAEQAIKALFVISPEPEKACTDIILGMYNTSLRDGSTCHPLRLARFFHVLGCIVLNLLVYTEALSSSVRRASAAKSLKRQEEADKVKTAKHGRRASTTSQDSKEDEIEAELGIAAEAEAENERKMAEISEKEILGRGLISVFSPLLVRVVANEGGDFQSETLAEASTLALCKFMCVSSTFCEKHLPLLFKSLASASADHTALRSNTVVALGDLAFRFPNEVEPYTPRLYACLRDPSTKVRRHTLMVLTHLILNDMVKVKGQVCEIALCLKDDDPRIRDMSRLLFHELSKRSNNPIYNLLPDIISQLSQMSMPKDDFRGVMTFLLGYITKERQIEMLADKLCHRFPKAVSISQKADIAYCLAQLKVTERMIKTLSDHFKLYKDALFDDDIKKSFASIVTKAKKFSKPEARQFIDDWEAKLNENADLSAENEETRKKATLAKARASQRARKKAQMEAIQEDEDVEFAEEDNENDQSDNDDLTDKENTVRGASRATKTTKKTPAKKSRRKQQQPEVLSL